MRGVVVALVFLALAPAAHAACPVTASASRGAAPLRVTFHAACASVTYRWNFGDGRKGAGARVTHAYRGGRFTPTVTTDHGVRKLRPVTSVALTLRAPAHARYGEAVTFRVQVVPKVPVRLAGQPFRGGSLTVTATHPSWTAVAGGVAVRRTIRLVPRLDIRIEGTRTIGSPLHVVAILRPAHAGRLQVLVDGLPTTRIDTSSVRASRIVVSSEPKPDWLAATRVVHAHVHAPTLAPGARGPAVAALEQRLEDLHYALERRDGVFGGDDEAAVLAFQKVNGLARDGIVTPSLWERLARSGVPQARYGGDHVEVDKTRQVLFLVRDGKVALATHVSTGATGNTPLGQWHVYRKVVGWSWVLWYPNYFLRGFAIHGYPEVPAYPASHGCVRIPMWLAPRLFTQIGLGSTIFVY